MFSRDYYYFTYYMRYHANHNKLLTVCQPMYHRNQLANSCCYRSLAQVLLLQTSDCFTKQHTADYKMHGQFQMRLYILHHKLRRRTHYQDHTPTSGYLLHCVLLLCIQINRAILYCFLLHFLLSIYLSLELPLKLLFSSLCRVSKYW